MKICPVGAEVFREDRPTNRQMWRS